MYFLKPEVSVTQNQVQNSGPKFKFYQKRNFGDTVESSKVSVDFSERNASVAKIRNFELLCSLGRNSLQNFAIDSSDS
jgi:hypothetical protein